MTTKVMFLKDTDGKFKDIVYALFPEEIANFRGEVYFYTKVGQHGSCDKNYTLSLSTLASIKEYFPLLQELKEIGYNDLDIIYQF